jgi:streptogramin lyase
VDGLPTPSALRLIRHWRVPDGGNQIVFDPQGNLVTRGGEKIWKLSPEGQVLVTYANFGMLTDELAIGPQGDTWVSSSGGNLYRMTESGEVAQTFAGSSSDWFSPPFLFQPNDEIWVGADFASKVLVYNHAGKVVRTLPISVGHLARDSRGVIWSFADRVRQLGDDGTELKALTLPRGFSDFSFDASGRAWITSSLGKALMRVSPDLELSGQTALAEEPNSICADRKGNVWVTYGQVPSLTQVSPEGVIVESVTTTWHPSAMETDAEGHLWIALQRFIPDTGLQVVFAEYEVR